MTATRSILLAIVVTASAAQLQAAVITGVSVPVYSHDAGSYPLSSGVWSVSAPPYPLNTSSGIGYILNPTVASAFSIHDHVYVSPHIPNPSRGVVTYEFNQAAVVDQLEVRQHTNGVTRMEGFVGDSLGSLTSIGSIFGPAGDVTGGGVFVEHSSYVFDFDNVLAGRFFQVVIRKTSASNGYASYQMFPRDAQGVAFEPIPEPATLVLLASGAAVVFRRRARK